MAGAFAPPKRLRPSRRDKPGDAGELILVGPLAANPAAFVGIDRLSASNGCRIAFPRRMAPELCITSALETNGGAQGRPGAGRARGPPAAKNAGGRHHRSAEHARPSPRNGWNGLYVV